MPGATRPLPPAPPLPRGALRGLYAWLDTLPLSRPKSQNLARDFSDGVMLAEIVKFFLPRLVDLHNYVPTCSTDRKLSNWSVLNRRVFRKLGFCVSEADIQKVVANRPGAVEPILCVLREKVEAGTLDPALGLQDPPAPSGTKPLGNEQPPDPGCCACRGQAAPCPPPCMSTGCRQLAGCLDPAPPPQREEKEQALALLQEAVRKDPARCRGHMGSLLGLLSQLLPARTPSPPPAGQDPPASCSSAGVGGQLGTQPALRAVSPKLLQMKVHRLELLLALRGQRIVELTRRGSPGHGPHPSPQR